MNFLRSSIAVLMYSGILENSADRISMILLNSPESKDSDLPL